MDPKVQVYLYMRSKNKPKISVVIPNYNRAHNLSEVLKDCMSQTSLPFEIIIQDNSFEKTEMMKVDQVVSRYKNIKFSRNSKNLGLVPNVNLVIKKAKGDYVTIVNNDDRISPRYIEEIQKFVKTYPNFKVYTTNACAISDNGNVFGDYRLYSKDTVIKEKRGITHLWDNYFINLISISGATTYKRGYIQSHLFKTKYGNEADLDNVLGFLSSQDIMYIDLPIYFVRMNSVNTSIEVRSTTDRLDVYINRCLDIYEKYIPMFKKTPLYMTRPKTVYFLQLLFKYHYSLTKIKSILRLERWSELLPILATIPSFAVIQFKQRILFQLHKHLYKNIIR